MIKFSTQSGSWKIDSPTIEVYYRIQNWLALADQSEAKVRLISLLSLAPEEEVRAMKEDKFAKLWNEVELGPLSAINTAQFQKEIEVEGVRYGILNIANLTIGELADLDTLNNHPQSSQQLHKMMAVLYRPINEQGVVEAYTTEGYDQRAELFLKHLNISNVMAAIDFFFHITKISLDSTLDSLKLTMTNLMTDLDPHQKNQVTKKLQEVGLSLSTSLQEMTY